MPLSDRDYMRGKHPPSCTCVDCVNERLGITSNQQQTKYNKDEKTPNSPLHIKKQESVNSEITQPQYDDNAPQKPTGDTKTKGKSRNQLPKWLTAVLFIFAFSILGWGISLLVENTIPLIILAGFPFIYSIEKWFSHATKRHKSIGKFYRFILNLATLSFLGLLIWSGIQLFSQQFFQSSIIGSLIFIAEFIFFIWIWKVVAKNSWRWPSMKLTIFSLIVLFLVFAYAGVEPIKTYKDTAFSNIGSFFSNLRNTADEQGLISTPATVSTTPPATNPTVIEVKTEGIDEKTGVYKNYYLGLVKTPEGVSGGENCYGEFIVLINNKNAKNTTYTELITFLKSDNTDEFPYQNTLSLIGFYYGEAEDKIDLDYIKEIIDGTKKPASPKVCADFAERLHNNAEMAGIRCGYVIIDSINHALNVFETTDKGLVYIDDTGTFLWGPSNCDKIVDVKEGIEYVPESIFHEYGWSDTWDSIGIIDDIFVTWDGEWR